MPELDLSDAGLRFIGRWEGLRLVPYNDVANNATVGYGHLLHTGPVNDHDRAFWHFLTAQHALAILLMDAAQAVAAVRHFISPPIVLQHRFDALVSLAFNIGTGAFEHSTLVRRLNAGSRGERTADEFLRWDRAGGRVVPGLANRRRAERRLFLHGLYDG